MFCIDDWDKFLILDMSINREWNIVKKKMSYEIAQLNNQMRSSSKLIDFLIIAEDHRYYNHIGFDVISIIRALYKNLFLNKHEGASTIEQQLIRVLTNDYRYSFKRKIKEIILAVMLKKIADKRLIAFVYLNIAYYGTNYQNLASIMNKFGLNDNDLISDDVCAEIVSRLKYPEPCLFNERRMYQIEKRKNYILNLYSHNK